MTSEELMAFDTRSLNDEWGTGRRKPPEISRKSYLIGVLCFLSRPFSFHIAMSLFIFLQLNKLYRAIRSDNFIYMENRNVRPS